MESLNPPLVTVICICYNHERFIKESLQSVIDQTHPSVELIIIDNNSVDSSLQLITEFVKNHEKCNLITNSVNVGNCKAFNQGLAASRGEYLIDLSGDDILEPYRIEIGVSDLIRNGIGVHYSDAILIDEDGAEIGLHSEKTKTVRPGPDQPQGNVFEEILSRYFICPPTIMANRSVYEKLGGYDESLAFEDFDFLVRSSRDFEFCYSSEPLVRRRIVSGSQSTRQYKRGSPYLESTYKVCHKAAMLLKSKSEEEALLQRIKYEIGQTIKLNERAITQKYLELMRQNNTSNSKLWKYELVSKLRSVFG